MAERNMFIKIGDIKGESVVEQYKGWIDVLAWSWGMSQSGTFTYGEGGGAGRANIQDFSFTKHLDSCSHVLMQFCCTGKHIPQATFAMLKAAGDEKGGLEFYKLIFHDLLISSTSVGGAGGERMYTENVTLNFAKYEIHYNTQQKGGAGAGWAVSKFDLAMNKVW
jgi:type VI secretion system secreted protein Hcp